jgi:hypothetical protein
MNVFFNAKEWTKENSNILGLPRPTFEVPKEFAKNKPIGSKLISKTKLYLHKKIPIPWQSEPVFNGLQQLTLNVENEEKVYKEGRCAFCGILFIAEESAIRWTTVKGIPNPTGPNVFSDNFPFHQECMKQARRFCPFMRTTINEEFEYGPFELLRLKADEHIKNIKEIKKINDNI